jgi:hypothetical protein
MDQSLGKRRMTLAQLTLALLQLEADQVKQPAGRMLLGADPPSEDPVAFQIALGMAKHRTSE